MSARVPAGALILSPEDARILCQVAGISNLRVSHRIGDTRVYRLLTDITLTAYQIADVGNLPRQESASEEPEYMTVTQVARKAGLSPRAVRLDCQHQRLPAQKSPTWLIHRDDAAIYIAGRRRQ